MVAVDLAHRPGRTDRSAEVVRSQKVKLFNGAIAYIHILKKRKGKATIRWNYYETAAHIADVGRPF